MAFTGKQIRNGVAMSGGEQNPAQPGPMPDVASVLSHAQTAALDRKGAGAAMFGTAAGAGPDNSSTPENPGRVLGNAHTDIYDWDGGLAIDEPSGEA